MYDKAFREFDTSNYEQALKDLDAIDARQPDLAESQNLRGVILMRQKDYANAEKALGKALAADPKFWNARFNLAEIPFLDKKWPEARKRFQELLSGNASELQGEATQLIQYKIMITYLMEGKEDMVSAMMAKLELSPDTPAMQYATAAIALHKKNDKEAKDALTAAEKNFSPQLNKLFAESLYEVGWLEKPAGQTRAALELSSQAERDAQRKTYAKAKFDEAEQALQQRDLTAARKLVDEADAADPNQASIINLRGEVLLDQKEFNQAESEFRKAQKLDPNLRDAQYNLAQVPFKKKEYAKARDRFEALFSSTSGTDKDRAAQLIKFKIYLTLLLEGKDSRARKMMEQFQFTGDTPALYYAQAAWEFRHDNPAKGNDWVNSARKIYPLALNNVFADSFFDLGWLQTASAGTTMASASGAQPEIAPSIEPTPIPAVTLAQNSLVKTAEPPAITAPPNSPISGMEATSSNTSGSAAASSALAGAASPSVETPVASTAAPAASQSVVSSASEPEPASAAPAVAAPRPLAPLSARPATVLAPAKVREWSEPTWTERLEQMGVQNVPLFGALVLAAILLLSWVMIPELSRRFFKSSAKPSTASAEATDLNPVGAVEQLVAPTRLAGGPPQMSLQLRASEPALRRAVMPLGKSAVASGGGWGTGHGAIVTATPAPAETFVSPEPDVLPAAASFEEGVGEPIAAVTEEPAKFEASLIESPAARQAEEHDLAMAKAEVAEPAYASDESVYEYEDGSYEDDQVAEPDMEQPAAKEFIPATAEVPVELEPKMEVPAEEAEDMEQPAAKEFIPAMAEMPVDLEPSMEVPAEEAEPYMEQPAAEEFVPAMAEMPVELHPTMEVPAGESLALASSTPAVEEFEPIGQGQPVPYLTAAPAAEISQPEPETAWEHPAAAAAFGVGLAGIAALSHSVEPPSTSETVSHEPMAQQPTTPATMSPTIQPSPATRTPSPTAQPGAQPIPGGMHTAVQLTISFEIASLQLTPSFKMGGLQLKPTSKIVTMRLAPSQNPAPAMNLQVTFEIASVQLAGNSLGTIRLTPSQQQRPGISSSPAFNIAGLQLVSGAESAPVQITPSQQGQASVHVTAGFQIATVEFSPSFEISSIILNSTSRNVSVQLPGSGPSAIEGAPIFEITSVQLGSNGEISTMQLNPPGAAAKRA